MGYFLIFFVVPSLVTHANFFPALLTLSASALTLSSRLRSVQRSRNVGRFPLHSPNRAHLLNGDLLAGPIFVLASFILLREALTAHVICLVASSDSICCDVPQKLASRQLSRYHISFAFFQDPLTFPGFLGEVIFFRSVNIFPAF